MKVTSSLVALLVVAQCGCAHKRPASVTAPPSFTAVQQRNQDSTRSVVEVKKHLTRAQQLAAEADYKLMRGAEYF